MSMASSVASSGSAAWGWAHGGWHRREPVRARGRPSWVRLGMERCRPYSLTGPDAMMICWNATGGLDCEHLPFERAAINSSVK